MNKKILYIFFILLLPQQSLGEGKIDLTENERLARQFFLESTKSSLNNLSKADKPIQADLYIITHFLMYNDELKFTLNNTESLDLRKNIIEYLKGISKTDILWEGCLAAKLLIGLSNYPENKKFEQDFYSDYQQFIKDHWNDTGIGECFVPGIERSYGQEFPEVYCTESTQELELKMLYYYAHSSLKGIKPSKNDFPSMNKLLFTEINDWWKAVVEMWVIRNYQEPKSRKFISTKRYEHAKTLVKQSLEKDYENGMIKSLISYSYLLAFKQSNAKVEKFLSDVAETQLDSGAIPSSIGSADKPHHNYHATPTYFFLLAAKALREAQ